MFFFFFVFCFGFLGGGRGGVFSRGGEGGPPTFLCFFLPLFGVFPTPGKPRGNFGGFLKSGGGYFSSGGFWFFPKVYLFFEGGVVWSGGVRGGLLGGLVPKEGFVAVCPVFRAAQPVAGFLLVGPEIGLVCCCPGSGAATLPCHFVVVKFFSCTLVPQGVEPVIPSFWVLANLNVGHGQYSPFWLSGTLK
eukprot:FR740194.1.p1 GENE.FR740194.1~~FR740194.1.p1  ORF type:complete len:190 (-),score=80.25 FR740194.1:196-765(-)